MPQLGLQVVQAAARSSSEQQDKPLDELQLHFSKQFNNLFNRLMQIRDYKVQVDSF